jgi:hypothetical protein
MSGELKRTSVRYDVSLGWTLGTELKYTLIYVLTKLYYRLLIDYSDPFTQ